ncbi:uncharacterized protein LOC134740879 [Cydia strobilella]|uniref:uncharacterized protein LOC134740879 n=1 Tax=Cydia strobilella TaxID=1100964 RepID=UPI00300552FB
MENVVECDKCVCVSGATLDVLNEVQRAYEHRLELVERVGGADKVQVRLFFVLSYNVCMQMQSRVLRSWVSDLVAQNALLVRAVEELERESTSRAETERRRHAESYNGMETQDKNLELSLVNESLQNDVTAKDREIKSLKKDLQQYEKSMARVRGEGKPNVQMKDAEVMAGMCCTGAECGDLVPVQDIEVLVREEAGKYRERIRNMEISLQSSGVKLRAVHKLNLGLIEELSSLRRLVVAVDVERRDARVKLDLQRTIVRQMVRQLRQAKAQLKKKELSDYSTKSDFVSGDNFGQPMSHASLPAVAAPCTRQPRPRRRDVPPPPPPPPPPADNPHPLTDQLDSSGDFRPFHEDHVCVCACVVTSTPNGTIELPDESQFSMIPPRIQSPITISDDDSEANEVLLACDCDDHQAAATNVHEQTTLRLDTPDHTQTQLNHSLDLTLESSTRNQNGHPLWRCSWARQCVRGRRGVCGVTCVESCDEYVCVFMLIVVMMTMMFNGLACVDSDNSDFTKDSGGGGGGGGSSCAGACERYYRDKLIATLQILENKEETIRVQGSSLGVAEGRIAELTKRASELRQELDHKAQELSQLRQFAESCRVDKSDVSISAEIKEVEGQRQLVQTLEDNLAVVTELYRECFYDAAKQEELIDMLRKSYLDVRLMEKAKTDKITKLHNIINTQKRSIEQCQDVVMEVESLKSEISSFLNSSNNDSGMWERGSESPDVGEELADILDQLRQLQHMLTTDCTCGLQEENSSLKERNRILEAELEQIRQRNKDLDESLRHILSQQHEKQMKEKERETEEAVKKLAEVENICKERGEACETLKRQLQQAQVLLDDKTAELLEAQKTSAAKDVTIRGLHQNLEHSEKLVQEGLMKLSEVAKSRSELLLKSQATISELEQRLKHSVRRCRELEAGCRERERSTLELQACLEEAQARGARLCEESRRVTAGVRQWMREKKQQTREQQDKIKMQKLRIRELECCVRTRQNDLTSQSETEPSSSVSQCESGTYRRRLRPTCSSEINAPSGSLAGCVARENETASCSKCVSNRQQESGSEMASCSRAPVPPTRKKRQQSCNDFNCPTSRPSRDRFEPSSHPDVRWTRLYSRLPRQLSPGERAEYRRPRRQVTADELLQRVEHLHTGLVDGQRRWGRHRQ